MPLLTRSSFPTLIALLVLVLLALGGFVFSGVYNMGADAAHSRPVHALLETLRERSISVRASRLPPPPDLGDPERIRQGAGNYDSMCTGCHLAPGMAETELSRGLYPAPPAFAKAAPGNPAHHFWVIKHGIKASGMPAWGMSMEDEYIWGMVAFLQQMPTLDAAAYQALVASSGGHSHGGGETRPHGMGEGMDEAHESMSNPNAPIDESQPHVHAPGTPPHDDASSDSPAGINVSPEPSDGNSNPQSHPSGPPADHHAAPAASTSGGMIEHRHADGTVESHPAPDSAPADRSHDH